MLKTVKYIVLLVIIIIIIIIMARGSVVVKALCYKLRRSGFETRWGESISQFTKSFQPH
jgi:hypothetical protein